MDLVLIAAVEDDSCVVWEVLLDFFVRELLDELDLCEDVTACVDRVAWVLLECFVWELDDVCVLGCEEVWVLECEEVWLVECGTLMIACKNNQ